MANKQESTTGDVFERTFLITDTCMWEQNKQQGAYHPHSIQVVDTETGQVRYIASGSKIKFVGGAITEGHSQDEYNKIEQPTEVKEICVELNGGKKPLELPSFLLPRTRPPYRFAFVATAMLVGYGLFNEYLEALSPLQALAALLVALVVCASALARDTFPND